ncbi:PH domain-containing protein [Cucurbitaria berberidis CBS 394.84]|uniref:PH domain-containing protein n=1 Tax=Cucurbitaria berberidis CBS 394.84 TaxID=1168544 RepID=A0A9P4GE52_9PLEO|nr:PH domain-containing protein [Cucurbitaria berberidis CBS 394.84]KAF1843656.1 PH domain-containing protein [Cucurbitaria berberidis CBS 394.84]
MATQRSDTPSGSYNPVPDIHDPSHLSRGYGNSSHLDVGVTDFANTPAEAHTERRGRFEEEFDARTRGSSVLDGDVPQRSASRASRASTLNQGSTPARSGTLKKKASVKRSASLKRSGSRKSMHAGSIRGVTIDDQEQGYDRENSVFYTPVPTKGSPTEVLADRFQTWRKFLKDLIAYFREVASSYEHRAKSLLKVSNVINNTNAPPALLTEGGLNDANRFLRDFHKQAIVEANKARDIEADVINQLSGLRADLAQKIKEIKSLSGDFKNNVEREKETTRKCVTALEEALAVIDSDPTAVAGKGDPYVVRLGVERQVERQIDEENYLHRAYLNLENSGRELESIVVGEVQKSYNALASILKRDADEMYNTVDKLRSGPIAMSRDHEWNRFVRSDVHFVNPELPLRRLEEIEYPGKHHPATTEVRAGMLERKSKYLKSYTPGWYVLSPTHLHEFKSADRIYTQPPVMSLYLPDQKLGSRSQPGSSSHKFVIKGRQTGSMHRGHTWVFRAETYETMLAWFDDIKTLTEKTGEERNAFVRRHASVRSTSAGSARSASSDGGLEEDEADAIPYSANQSMKNQALRDESLERPSRPSPGGRFPSDLLVNRNLQAPLSPSSGSSEVGNDLSTAAGGLQQNVNPEYPVESTQHPESFQTVQPPQGHQAASYVNPFPPTQQTYENQASYVDPYASTSQAYDNDPSYTQQHYEPQQPYAQASHADPAPFERQDTSYGNWMAPAAGGAAAGVLANEAYRRRQMEEQERSQQQQEQHYPAELPRTLSSLGSTPAIPERNPNHIAPDQIDDTGYVAQTRAPGPDQIDDTGYVAPPTAFLPSSVVPVPISAPSSNQNAPVTPATTAESFLADSEVGTSAPFGKTINGGPVPVELIETAQARAHPGMARQNTDISVSDLHVPGEYPKIRVGSSRVPMP